MSYTQLSVSTPKAAKVHSCIWCGQRIHIGEKYTRESGVYDGDMQSNAWHPECHKASGDYFSESGEEEFTPYDNPRGKVRED